MLECVEGYQSLILNWLSQQNKVLNEKGNPYTTVLRLLQSGAQRSDWSNGAQWSKSKQIYLISLFTFGPTCLQKPLLHKSTRMSLLINESSLLGSLLLGSPLLKKNTVMGCFTRRAYNACSSNITFTNNLALEVV